MAAQSFHSKLISLTEVAHETLAVCFDKPLGFSYKAGQSIDLTLVNPPETDSEGNTRSFSLASSPHEDTLLIATRLRKTAYKRVLRNLSPGAPLELLGPFGSFTLPSSQTRTCVFLMGGIGITPARSMIQEAIYEHRTNPLFLFYSNRTVADAAFFSEFETISKTYPLLHFIPTITEATPNATWHGETGFIRTDLIKKYLPEVQEPLYYLCGPPMMVAAMRDMLETLNIPNENIRTEEFAGY